MADVAPSDPIAAGSQADAQADVPHPSDPENPTDVQQQASAIDDVAPAGGEEPATPKSATPRPAPEYPNQGRLQP